MSSVPTICSPGLGMDRMHSGDGPGLGSDLSGLGRWQGRRLGYWREWFEIVSPESQTRGCRPVWVKEANRP